MISSRCFFFTNVDALKTVTSFNDTRCAVLFDFGDFNAISIYISDCRRTLLFYAIFIDTRARKIVIPYLKSL